MIKVMSFNIRYGLADDGENRWENRKSLVIARIQAFAPDLLGLQECRDDAQAAFVKDNLPDYAFLGVRREGGGEAGLEMAPIAFQNSVFELQRSGHFWLSDTPQIPGSKGRDADLARTASWAKLRHRETGRSLYFLNTHFDYQPPATTAAGRLLKQWANRVVRQRPLIITGDFNADKDSPAYRVLAGRPPLSDTARQTEATFHGFGQPGGPAIDWILASRHFNVIATGIDRYHEGNLWPSDHFPITASLEWKE